MPHSSLEKADHSRVPELIHQIENHPHRDALQADLMQNQMYNPFNKNSKKMIHDMVNVEYFELCETTSKVLCSYCLSYWTRGIVYCTCANCLCHTDSTRKLNRDRFDTLSISNCVIKKGSPNGSRHEKTEEQTLYHIAHNAWKRCRKKRDFTGQEHTRILDRILKSPRYRKSQEEHGWTEEKRAEYDALAQEEQLPNIYAVHQIGKFN